MTDNQTFIVGEVLPRIASVSIHQGFHIAVTWDVGSRAGQSDVVDLGPTIMSYKLYAPLRDNPDLFRTVHVINYGSALGWGDGEEIDMSAEGVEDLAEQAMTAADFRAFLDRHKFTQEAAAAQLGISRRQVNYFLTSKAIPRTVALACAYLNLQAEEQASSYNDDLNSLETRVTDSEVPVFEYGSEAVKAELHKLRRFVTGSSNLQLRLNRTVWIGNAVSTVKTKDIASGKANLASLTTNKPVVIKP